jgi:uncharacterized membrane protein YccF (DUF307 family)
MTQPSGAGSAGAPSVARPPLGGPAVFLHEQRRGPNLLVRAIWYVFVGWWLTGFLMGLAYLAVLTVIGIPIGFWLVNRLPTFLTLRPRRDVWQTTVDAYGNVRHTQLDVPQQSLLVRIAWFVLVGWWLAGITMVLAYVLMLTILGIPAGLMLVNRLPRVFTLHRGYA